MTKEEAKAIWDNANLREGDFPIWWLHYSYTCSGGNEWIKTDTLLPPRGLMVICRQFGSDRPLVRGWDCGVIADRNWESNLNPLVAHNTFIERVKEWKRFPPISETQHD